MLVIREVFRCKPGKAGALIEKFKAVNAVAEKAGVSPGRIMVDAVSTYWTVITEFEAEDMATFEREMQEYGSSDEMRAAMDGYMELVDGGHREIFRVV